MFYDIILELCSEKNVKITNVIKNLNMSSGNMARWKNGILPNSETLISLADYFNVSTDYLLGRTNVKNSDLTESEFLLIEQCRNNPKISTAIKTLLNNQTSEKIHTTAWDESTHKNFPKSPKQHDFGIAAWGGEITPPKKKIRTT